MKTKVSLAAVVLLAATSLASIHVRHTNAEEEAVKALVYKAYINGAFNALDATAMEAGFHQDFAIFSPKGQELSRYEIEDWVAGVKKRRANNYDPQDPKNVWEHKFPMVEVSDNAAVVKVELYNRGKHVYTDYLSLLNFEGEWKIVAKVYNKHE